MGDRREVEFRLVPRFTMNSLAEYVYAVPTRRDTILRQNIKKSPSYGASRYEYARRALVPFYIDSTKGAAYLIEVATRLRERSTDSSLNEHEVTCLRSSALALEAFAPRAEGTRPRRLMAVPGSRRAAEIEIAGLKVAVNPDINFIQAGSDAHIGGLKLHIGLTHKLDKDALQAAAVLMSLYFRENGEPVHDRNCISIDVFTGNHEATPRAVKDRTKNIKICCREIVAQWAQVYAEVVERHGSRVDQWESADPGDID